MGVKETAKLVWKSKPKREPSPKDLEFQTAEVVLPTLLKPEEAKGLDFPRTSEGEPEVSRMNRLIWGDNLLVMQALLAQGYEGKIDLIYIDPPFWTGDNFTMKVHLPPEAGQEDMEKGPTPVERLAYMDTWQRGIDSYLDMLYPRLVLMRKLLADTGSIYVHLDWHVGHYVKVMMDEIFGKENFRNEVVWFYGGRGAKAISGQFPRNYDILLVYSKTLSGMLTKVYTTWKIPVSQATKYGFKQDEKGRWFKTAPRGDYTDESMEQLKKEGRVYITRGGNIRIKYFLEEENGFVLEKKMVGDVWDDIPDMMHTAKEERLDFGTQKPEALLKRVILASSNPGDLVADFFCGSGTTLAVAEKLGRRWIGCDLGKAAIQISRCRLVHLGAGPFVIENIGNYQKELVYLEGMNLKKMYRLVLKLIGANPREDHPELGILQVNNEKAVVFVGHPDRPVTARMVEEKVRQVRTLDGAGYHKLIVLGFDYESNFEERWRSRQIAGFDVQFLQIPNEIFDLMKRVKAEDELMGKIQFFEKPYLKLGKPRTLSQDKKSAEVEVALERYVMKDFPKTMTRKQDAAEVRKKLLEIEQKNWPALIDWWAVDWDFDGKTFVCRWQTHRGFGKRVHIVPTSARFKLERRPIRYTIAVRVVDIFGNDATALTHIDLRE